MSIRERMTAAGPKRLLALDGGGIRGVITLEVLARMEQQLRERTGRPDLVLADVFDYVGGTSTGAIIAAGLAIGHPVDRLIALYDERGAEMFEPARLRDRVRHQYRHDPLERILKDELGEHTTMGSDRLRTLLLVVLRNASTDSPWPLSSNPDAEFNDRALPDCNLDLPLWQLVRASTAAPMYFAPEQIRLGDRDFVFVDGGVTPFNNPALQLALMATAPAYNLGWPTGEDELLLVSVGTGNTAAHRPELQVDDLHLLRQAAATIGGLLISSAAQQDLLCRLLGRCRHGDAIDHEVGDLLGGGGLLAEPLFSYVRYDRELTREHLAGLGLPSLRPGDLLAIDSVDHLDDLHAVGRALAEEVVDLDHLRGFLPDSGAAPAQAAT